MGGRGAARARPGLPWAAASHSCECGRPSPARLHLLCFSFSELALHLCPPGHDKHPCKAAWRPASGRPARRPPPGSQLADASFGCCLAAAPWRGARGPAEAEGLGFSRGSPAQASGLSGQRQRQRRSLGCIKLPLQLGVERGHLGHPTPRQFRWWQLLPPPLLLGLGRLPCCQLGAWGAPRGDPGAHGCWLAGQWQPVLKSGERGCERRWSIHHVQRCCSSVRARQWCRQEVVWFEGVSSWADVGSSLTDGWTMHRHPCCLSRAHASHPVSGWPLAGRKQQWGAVAEQAARRGWL